MKHPVRDRILMLIYGLASLVGAAGVAAYAAGRLDLAADKLAFADGVVSVPVMAYLNYWNESGLTTRARVVLIVAAVVLLLFALGLLGAILPAKRKRSSNFAIQRNENGMVRISLKAIETLVQKCLNQHAELKVVTSSLYSDEESIRVDVHIMLQSDISMPLAISALQKQIKKYLEACSGVMVQEVRVFVDGTTPATEETAQSPYAIPASLLGLGPDALPSGAQEEPQAQPAPQEEPVAQAEPVAEPVAETVAAQEPQAEEPALQEEAPAKEDEQKDEGELA